MASIVEFAPLEIDRLNWHADSELPPQVPKVDISKVNTDEELAQFLASIRESGIFYVVNHGIPEHVPVGAYNSFREFCNLPVETRSEYRSDPKFEHGGYLGDKETSVAKGNYGENVQDYVLKYFWRGADVVNRTPNDSFKESHDLYHRHTEALARRIISKILQALSRHFSGFTPDAHKEILNSRMFFNNRIYPGSPPEEDNAEYRLVPHQDISYITIVNQTPADNGYKGLFLVTGDGEKVAIPAIRNSYVVFIGQSLAYHTRKFLPAALHGVDFPTLDQFEGSERCSHVSFYEPTDVLRPYEHITPTEEETNENACPFYDAIGAGDEGVVWEEVTDKFLEGYYDTSTEKMD